MTETTLRNGITTKEAVRALDFKKCFVIVKNEKDETLDRYWFDSEILPHYMTKRETDNMKVLTISVTYEVSIIRFSQDPRVTITVR